jgi:tripartite ATP-independent transporter DctP family solute receptor
MSIWKKIGAAATVAGIAVVAVVFATVSKSHSTDGTLIRLAHNQADGSEIADTIAKFADFVEEDPSKDLSVQIYPSGILGTENEEIEMVQAGILDMAKVSSQTLSQFDARYAIFSVPYLFTGKEHYYEAMEKSEKIQELFESTADQGFIAIGYYANGARNFYTKEDVCVDDPSDLKGKKIRSMSSSTSMDMISAMGGAPVPMSSGETYTALQQGVVDGAENTELVLTVNGHEDLVSAYTYTEHQYSPDIYIISTDTWNKLTPEQQQHLKDSLTKTNDNFKAKYDQMMAEAIEEAKEHGVKIYYDIDKTAFIEAVQPIQEEFKARGEEYKALFEDIESYSDLMTKEAE